MLNIRTEFIEWLLRIGVAENNIMLVLHIASIIGIIAIILIVDRICKKVVIPAIRKITRKTQS